LGAIAVKQAVYVLPNSAQAVEDFEWLRSEIQSSRGDASIFSAASIDGVTEKDIVEQFRRARMADYKVLLKQVRQVQRRAGVLRGRDDLARVVRQLRDKLTAVQAIDFFAAPGGAAADQELRQLEESQRRIAGPGPAPDQEGDVVQPDDYQKRVWVTRPRPGVDRFASAWLITQFIDPDARFEFADRIDTRSPAVPFDMFGGGFGHEGHSCTFEVLERRFQIREIAVRRIGEIVHDLDLKEERFRPPQAPGVAVLVEGLRARYSDDAALLQQGIVLFDALYRGLQPQQPQGNEP
jgi:hypothetical protein